MDLIESEIKQEESGVEHTPAKSNEEIVHEFKLQLIESVRNNSLIWRRNMWNGRTKIPKKSQRLKIAECWRNVSSELRTPANLCKKRWEGVRNSYYAAQKQTPVKNRSYKCQVRYFPLLTFLDPYIDVPTKKSNPTLVQLPEENKFPVKSKPSANQLNGIVYSRNINRTVVNGRLHDFRTFIDEAKQKMLEHSVVMRTREKDIYQAGHQQSVLVRFIYDREKKRLERSVGSNASGKRIEQSVNSRTSGKSIYKDVNPADRFICKLIEEVRVRNNIWDVTSDSFHDDDLKERSWKTIALKLNSTANKCLTIFEVLRNAYFKSLNTNLKNESQQNGKEDNVSNSKYFRYLAFLNPVESSTSTAMEVDSFLEEKISPSISTETTPTMELGHDTQPTSIPIVRDTYPCSSFQNAKSKNFTDESMPPILHPVKMMDLMPVLHPIIKEEHMLACKECPKTLQTDLLSKAITSVVAAEAVSRDDNFEISLPRLKRGRPSKKAKQFITSLKPISNSFQHPAGNSGPQILSTQLEPFAVTAAAISADGDLNIRLPRLKSSRPSKTKQSVMVLNPVNNSFQCPTKKSGPEILSTHSLLDSEFSGCSTSSSNIGITMYTTDFKPDPDDHRTAGVSAPVSGLSINNVNDNNQIIPKLEPLEEDIDDQIIVKMEPSMEDGDAIDFHSSQDLIPIKEKPINLLDNSKKLMKTICINSSRGPIKLCIVNK